MNKPPLQSQTPLLRDFDMDSVMLGPSTRMLALETDPQGGLLYQFGRRNARCIQLPRAYGATRLGVLDTLRAALILNIKNQRLLGVASFVGQGARTILLAEHWGKWINEHFVTYTTDNIPLLMQEWRLPINVDALKRTVCCEFPINIHIREIFSRDAIALFREGPVQHVMELVFSYPSGRFQLARLIIRDRQSGAVYAGYDLHDFPLIWPPAVTLSGEPGRARQGEAKSAQATAAPPVAPESGKEKSRAEGSSREIPGGKSAPSAGRASGTTIRPGLRRETSTAGSSIRPTPSNPVPPPPKAEATPGPSPSRPAAQSGGSTRNYQPYKTFIGQSSPDRPAAAAAPGNANAAAVPRTESLPLQILLAMLEQESDPEIRWKMIEANLLLGRPERTYPLILHYAELISERAVQWAPARLKTAFANEPGSVLVGLMHNWMVNQVMAISENNAEMDQIITWLREREIDRLFKLDLNKEPVSIEAARKVLRVDRNADEAAVKKAWRTLLGFINADHGRRQERAIHRKKDEIAKHLQVARNILLKSL